MCIMLFSYFLSWFFLQSIATVPLVHRLYYYEAFKSYINIYHK